MKCKAADVHSTGFQLSLPSFATVDRMLFYLSPFLKATSVVTDPLLQGFRSPLHSQTVSPAAARTLHQPENHKSWPRDLCIYNGGLPVGPHLLGCTLPFNCPHHLSLELDLVPLTQWESQFQLHPLTQVLASSSLRPGGSRQFPSTDLSGERLLASFLDPNQENTTGKIVTWGWPNSTPSSPKV